MIWNFLKRLYNRIMSTADNLASNTSKVASTTYYPIDNIIFSNTTTFTVNNTVSSTPQQFTISTNINQFARPVGIYSSDGGTTWNDMYGIASILISSGLTKNVVLGLQVSPGVDTNGVTYYVTVNSAVGAGTTFNLTCSIALLAVDEPDPLTALPILSSGTNKTAVASITPSTKIAVNYRPIVMATVLSTPSIGTAISSVPHGLTYVPDMAVWLFQGTLNSTALLQAGAFNNSIGLLGTGYPLVFMDSSNIYYAQWNIANTEYLIRLYKP